MKVSDVMKKRICVCTLAALSILFVTGCTVPFISKDDKDFSVVTDSGEEMTSIENEVPADTSVDDKTDTDDNHDDGINQSDTEQSYADDAADDLQKKDVIDDDPNAVELVFSDTIANDWQKTFHNKINELKGETRQVLGDDVFESVPSVGYFIYDIDNDSVPELFVRFGTCEADYFMKAYKCEGTTAKEVAYTFSGHTSYASMPEMGMVSIWGHMGYYSIGKMTLTADGFKGEEVYSQELNAGEGADKYTDVKTVVPGAKHLTEVPLNLDLPLWVYERNLYTSDGLTNDEAELKFETVMNQNKDVYAVSGDVFSETRGRVPFGTYLTKGYADKYYDVSIVDTSYRDMNGDGQEECVIKAKEKEDGSSYTIIILSIQNDTVYAYSFNLFGEPNYTGDGVFSTDESMDISYKLIFYKDQAFLSYE